jgi:hypothetical protein
LPYYGFAGFCLSVADNTLRSLAIQCAGRKVDTLLLKPNDTDEVWENIDNNIRRTQRDFKDDAVQFLLAQRMDKDLQSDAEGARVLCVQVFEQSLPPPPPAMLAYYQGVAFFLFGDTIIVKSHEHFAKARKHGATVYSRTSLEMMDSYGSRGGRLAKQEMDLRWFTPESVNVMLALHEADSTLQKQVRSEGDESKQEEGRYAESGHERREPGIQSPLRDNRSKRTRSRECDDSDSTPKRARNSSSTSLTDSRKRTRDASKRP